MTPEIKTDVKGISRFIIMPDVDREKLRFHVNEAEPSMQNCKSHSHKNGEEIVWVISGECEITVENQAFHLVQGEAILLNALNLHGIRNIGRTKNKYAVIRTNL